MQPHPAPFSKPILDRLGELLVGEKRARVLDPFAGTGRVLAALPHRSTATLIEIEQQFVDEGFEWIDTHRSEFPTIDFEFNCAESREWLRRNRRTYTHIVTSPCPHPDMRVLTADLRWVRAGDLAVGDRLLAFDEFSPSLKANGHQSRRKFRWAEVTQSTPSTKESMRVTLDNGDVLTVSEDHPWLAFKAASYTTAQWIETRDMRPGITDVMLQVRPWDEDRSYEAGWLAGMFDGEGSLAYGEHGTPKMSMCQVLGDVQDTVEQRLKMLGIPHFTIPRSLIDGRLPMMNTYVGDGWPGMLTALGKLRPQRLLRKFMEGDVSSRSIQPTRVRVVSIERVGVQPIQKLTTTTGTFICEGYLHHNTYGNRMSDGYRSKPGTQCRSYAQSVGGPLATRNSGAFKLSTTEYWDISREVMEAAINRLVPGGTVIINVSDFYRTVKKGEPPERQNVGYLWIELMWVLGLQLRAVETVVTRRFTRGENRHRVPYEYILIFKKE